MKFLIMSLLLLVSFNSFAGSWNCDLLAWEDEDFTAKFKVDVNKPLKVNLSKNVYARIDVSRNNQRDREEALDFSACVTLFHRNSSVYYMSCTNFEASQKAFNISADHQKATTYLKCRK